MSVGGVFDKLLNRRSGRLRELFVFDSKSTILSPPIIHDINGDGAPEIIFGTQDGKIFALREDSSVLWSYTVAEQVDEVESMFLDQTQANSINHAPCVADLTGKGDSFVLFGTEFGKVYLLTAHGKLVWSVQVDGPVRGGVIVADVDNDGKPEVIFGSSDKHLYVLSRSGKVVKKINVGSEIESTPSFINSLIIFGCNDGRICALDYSNGIDWSIQTKGKVISEAVLLERQDGTKMIVMGSTDSSMYCIDFNGALMWKFSTEGAIYSKATVDDVNDDGFPEIIFGSCDNNLYVLNDEGNRIWSFETDFWVIGSPVVMDIDGDGKKEIIIGSYDTYVYVLSGQGTYSMSYIPGLSGIVTQDGDYSDIPTQSPGDFLGRKLWLLKAPGIILGCCRFGSRIVAQTKEGMLLLLEHSNA